MMVSFKGIGQCCATFMGEALEEGCVVKVSAAGTVAQCEADEAFLGVVICAEEDAATVQVGGFAQVKYSGSAPAVGFVSLVADGKGGVQSGEGGKKVWVVDKDETEQTAMILL